MKFNLSTVSVLSSLTKALSDGLRKLSFDDNFESFTVEDVIITTYDDTDAESVQGTTAVIQNRLTFVPTKYIIVRQKGNGMVSIPDTNQWNSKELFLINYGPDDVTISVTFMR